MYNWNIPDISQCVRRNPLKDKRLIGCYDIRSPTLSIKSPQLQFMSQKATVIPIHSICSGAYRRLGESSELTLRGDRSRSN